MHRRSSLPGALPLLQWQANLRAAASQIVAAGERYVAYHSSLSSELAESASRMALRERQQAEQQELGVLTTASAAILGQLELVCHEPSPARMSEASRVLDEELPRIEHAYLVARHTAQDVLLWGERDPELPVDPLALKYRQSYQGLLTATPKLGAWLEEMEHHLADRAREAEYAGCALHLLRSTTRYRGMLDTGRRFVRAIVDPPLVLVFQEIEAYAADLSGLPEAKQASVITEINDLCQRLLYDIPTFESLVERIEFDLRHELESSLYEFNLEEQSVLFSVEQDPLFGRLTVHLFRIVPKEQGPQASQELLEALYEGMH